MSILRVNNLTKKSFKNYTGPTLNEEFKTKNIIFGYNGRGKTSLACGIIDEFLKNTSKNSNSYRFFNRSYITENLLLKDPESSQLKGVIANFGKKNIDAEKEIDKIKADLVDTSRLENNIQKLDKETRDEINKIHDNKKGKTSVQKKPADKSINEIIDLYNKDIIEARKIVKSDDELIKTTGDNSFEEQKLKIDTLNISNISLLSDEEIIEVNDIFNTVFDDINIPTSEIIEWLNEGLKIHSDGDKCKFCGGNIDFKKIEENVNQYNSNKKQKATLKLTNFRIKLLQIKKQVESVTIVKENIIANLGDGVKTNFEIVVGYQKEIDNFVLTVQDKIDSIDKKLEFDSAKLKTITMSIQEEINKIEQVKNTQIKSLQDRIDKLSVLIKGAIGLEIDRSTLIKNNITLIKEQKIELSNAERQNEENYGKIESVKRSKSNTSDFADHITNILSMLEVNLKLEVKNDNYIIKHSKSGEILKLNEISEGEQNLLALLYFYYELFEDNEQNNLKNSIELIIIDDPISSVDDINKMYVLELIKKLCLLDQPQLFIFTHIWEDFCNICYGKKDKNEPNNTTLFRFYEIKKDELGSRIVMAKTNESPYKHGFKEIYDFSQKTNCSDLSDCEIYHYPNIMRKILEEFLSFKIKNSSPTQDNFNNIKNVLCNGSATSTDELMIGTLLNVCNILSHRASRNPDEILKSAKYLMKKIELVDKQHFNTMKQ